MEVQGGSRFADMPQSPVISAAAPPAAPRELTPRVLRRTVFEPQVRFWWVSAFVLAVGLLYFLVTELQVWNQECYVVKHGTPVIATITAIGDGQLRYNVSPDNSVAMSFSLNGQQHQAIGWLEGRTETLNLNQQVPIKVNPDDPTQWTYRTDTPPLTRAFLTPGLMAPFAVAAGLASFIHRKRLIHTWKTGVAEQYVVERVGGQTALAPASRAVQFANPNGRKEQRLIRLLIPQRVANPKPGDVFWLIHPPKKTSPVLAAVLYQ